MSIEQKNNSKCEKSFDKEKSEEKNESDKKEEEKEIASKEDVITQKPENERKETTEKEKKEVEQNEQNQIPQNIKTEMIEGIKEDKKAEETIPKKKDWSTWSTQEKILFYEIIANGGNYSSLQKLFKTMNYVIDYLLFLIRK